MSRGQWHERNPERDTDPRIRGLYRELYPLQSEDIASGGGYNEDGDGATTVAASHHPRAMVADAAARDFMSGGGWGISDAQADYDNDQRRGGITYREPEVGEFVVDHERLISLVEQQLGYTFEEVRSVYKRAGGPLARDLRPLRDRIDGRLVELAADGGLNIARLAEVLGVNESTLDDALARGRKAVAA